MNVNFTIRREDKPVSVSHLMFSDVRKLLPSIRDNRKAVFSVERNTATSLLITVFSPDPAVEDCFSVAFVPKGAEDLKYLVQQTHNFFSAQTETRSFLKLTKTQRLPALERYLTAVLGQLFPDLDSLDAELIIWGVPELDD